MIYPENKMFVKYLDEEGNESTIKAESIVFWLWGLRKRM